MSGYCRAEIGDTPKLATKNSAHISRARVEYMISALHDDTNPPDLDQQWLILATPWPELLDQLSDRGSNLPVNTLARPRALCRVSCRKFICVVQNTEEFISIGPPSQAAHSNQSCKRAFRGVSRAARTGVFPRIGGTALQM